MSNIKIKYDENGSIVDAFDSSIEIDGDYIIVDSSIWSEYSKYSKDDLKIEDANIVILNGADKKLDIIKIKAKANELILARYSIIWQLNHPRGDIQYKSDYDFIDSIRRISNEAEIDGTKVEDILWQ